MIGALWFVTIGVLLVGMAAASTIVRRLPLTAALLYLAVGIAMGPAGAGLVTLAPVRDSALLERLTEIAVIVSLFAAGLKLRESITDRRWRLPIQLATISMSLTVGMIAAVAMLGLGLPLGAAVLLGAVLAPTDPVLASDVQLEHPTDPDQLRFALTGEAGLNDGAAFPFVMLGLGLLGLHDLGTHGWRWIAVDVAWATTVGIGTGWGLGWLVSHAVLWLRKEHKEAVGLSDLLALGLIALAYGVALLLKSYGFLAVFAAGLALRRQERVQTQAVGGTGGVPPDVRHAASTAEADHFATSAATAPAYMAQAALGFTEQLERVLEVGLVLLLGGMLTSRTVTASAWWFVPVLFLVVRPLAVLFGAPMRGAPLRRTLAMWFGIRGIGSIYYLMFALQHGVEGLLADQLVAIVFTTVAASIVIHGMSVTPLMRRYTVLMDHGARGRHPGHST